jgi:flagellar protein FlgJ
MTIQDQFFAATYKGALEMQKKFNLPALAVMAQSALETGWGVHAPGNMYFGIKAGGSWTGETQELMTKEFVGGKMISVKQTFRKYPNAQASFEDYARLITGNARYKAALLYPNDPIKYIIEIRKAGYATDPNYVLKCTSIINDLKKKVV